MSEEVPVNSGESLWRIPAGNDLVGDCTLSSIEGGVVQGFGSAPEAMLQEVRSPISKIE